MRYLAALLAVGLAGCFDFGKPPPDKREDNGEPAVPTALSAGERHSCALFSNGAVRCWGDNGDGQLGVEHADGMTLVEPKGLGLGVTGISSYWRSTCAVVKGAVKCWGSNELGQLGTGSRGGCILTPTTVPGLDCSTNDDSTYQLGDGTNTSRRVPTSMVDANGTAISGITAIAAGSYDVTCAIIDKKLKCWGGNWIGNVGNGSLSPQHNPVQVSDTDGHLVTSVSNGGSSACAVIDGGIKCWGWNVHGQLGNNSTDSSSVPVDTIAPNSGATVVVSGPVHSCAIVKNAIQCWGVNSNGQLGNGTTDESLVPVTAKF